VAGWVPSHHFIAYLPSFQNGSLTDKVMKLWITGLSL